MKKLSVCTTGIIITMLIVLPSFTFLMAQDSGTNGFETEEEAVEYLRDLQMDRAFEMGVLEGERLIEQFPESVELKAWYIASLARNDGAPEAVAEAEKLTEEHPDNPWSHFALVRALNSHDERGEEALEMVDRVLEMNPDHGDFLWMKAAVIYSQTGKEEAVAFVDSVHTGDTVHPQLLSIKGNGLMSMSRSAEGDEQERLFEEGAEVFERARQIDSTRSDAWYLPGYYYSVNRKNDMAYPLLKKAAENSLALRVHSMYWRTVMGLDELSMEEKTEEILSDMRRLEEQRPESANLLFNLANQYGDLQMPEKKREYEERILGEFTDDLYAEWVLVNRYREFRSEHSDAISDGDEELVAEYKQMLWDFINRPEHSRMTLLGDAYRNLFYVVRDDSTADPDTLLQIVNGMAEHEGINPHITHAGGAVALAEHGVDFDRAKELAREGVELAREKIDEQNERGLYDTEEEYRKAMGWFTGQMYDALGWVFFHEGKLDSAEKYLSKAYSLYSESRQTVYRLGQLHEKLGNHLKAEEYYVKGTGIDGMGENPNIGALRSLYIEMHGSEEGYDAYLAELREKNETDRREKILAERLEDPESMVPFELQNMEGETYTSDRLKGKISVINVWGKWCGPCVREMPDIQKLHEKYRDDPDIEVLTINNDPNKAELREWMEERDFDFPVLRDSGYLSEAGVHVFPTTWFLNTDTDIAYIKEGYTEELVEEFTWRIEDLEGE